MTAPPIVGELLGRYRIEEKIGQGGMGIVFRATDEKLCRVVALKVLSRGVVDDPARRRRFLREARIAAAITHPNIAIVHDVGETEDGDVYIAMELVEGPSLRQRLGPGALDSASAIRIAKDLTRALARAHKAGVVHRDVKPDNIMVSDELEVKVLDFGLGRPIEDAKPSEASSSLITEAGQLLGTPGYMSPEQAAGGSVDARTDVFAMGVVVYEMLTGKRPFTRASSLEIMIATARDEATAPSRILTSLSTELDAIVLRCLEKNADARYEDAGALLRALDGLSGAPPARLVAVLPGVADAGTMPTQGSLVGTTAPAQSGRARRWWLLAGLAAVGVVGVSVQRFGSASLRARAPPAPTSLIDLPLPSSTNAALLAEYAAGTQALHDDDWGTAQAHFERVVALDPLLALGQLRLAMVAEGTLDESIRREHYARAVTLRSQLSARDEGMMEALEPVLQRLREDRREAVTRLRLLRDRYPGDAEIHVWLGMPQEARLDGLAEAEQAIALDPRDGQAWQTRGDVLATLNRSEESRASYERCGALSPASAECFLGLIWVDAAEGRCADAERTARRAVDRDPHLAGHLAWAMAGAGRPIGAVREISDQLAATFTASSPTQRMMDQIRIALITGDFARARLLAEEYQAFADRTPNAPLREHLRPAEVLIGIARETGDDAQALRIGLDFLVRSDTWSKSTQGDVGIDAALVIERQAGVSRTEFLARRARWIDEEEHNLAHPGLIWTYGFAATVETEEEANEALKVLPAYAPLTSVVHYVGIPDAEIGRTYLLAGNFDAAIPYLTKAVAACVAFRHPFVHTRAALLLGEALERKGDAAGACRAYAKVVERWGNATPRSLSAETAKARVAALSCPR